MTNDKTVIFLDVDGVINHLGLFRLQRRHTLYNGSTNFTDQTAGQYTVRIPGFIPPLIQYLVENYEVYWLTTWRDRANQFISPLLGIPNDLPVIDDGTQQRAVSWKEGAARPIAAKLVAEGKRIFWIEDFYGRLPRIDGVIPIDTGFEEGLFPQHIADLLDDATYAKLVRLSGPLKGVPRQPISEVFSEADWVHDKSEDPETPLEVDFIWRLSKHGYEGTIVSVGDRYFGFLELPNGTIFEYPSDESFDAIAAEVTTDINIEYSLKTVDPSSIFHA